MWQDKFINKVESNDKGCLIWKGCKRKDRYINITYKGKTWLGHRLSYYLYYKRLPSLDICHTCDNPSCVNPLHLFEASHSDNMQDKIRKNRDHNTVKTRCKKGHAYIESNIYRSPGSRARHCRECRRIADKKRKGALIVQ